MTRDEAIAQALETLTYGLYVVSVEHKGESHAMIATWVTQVSFDPPLIVISVEKEAGARQMLDEGAGFVFHVFPVGGSALAKHVLKQGRLPAHGIDGRDSNSAANEGSQIFLTSMTCSTQQRVTVGDHVLYVAKVEGVSHHNPGEPLTLRETGWKYRKKPSHQKR